MTFPGENLVLGKYCGPSIYLGPALTSKSTRKNGQHVHRSTYKALTPDKLVKPNEIKARYGCNTVIKEKIGPAASAKDFECNP